MSQPQPDLRKTLGWWDSSAIIIAIVIGVGIFKVPAEAAQYIRSPVMLMLAWLVGGVIAFAGALCYAELSSAYPETGGNYVYLRTAYGKGIAFLFGWAELLVIRTGSIAAVAFIFAEYLQSFLSIRGCFVKPLAIFGIVLLSFINTRGITYGKRVQNIFIIAKITALCAILIFGFLSRKGTLAHFSASAPAMDIHTWQLFFLALIPILWTYGGWHESTFVAGETKNPAKTMPRALFTGVCTVTVLYMAINFLYIYLLPVEVIAGSKLIAADALSILYGRSGRKVLEAVVIVSSFASLNAMIITGSRVTYAMAADNPLFAYLGTISRTYQVPQRAIIINAAWSIVLILLGTFQRLLFFTGVLVWLFFALVTAALIRLRHKFPDIPRPYSVWGYPVLPVLFIFVAAMLVVNTIQFYPYQSLMGLGLFLSGIPVYYLSRGKRTSQSA